MKKYLTEEETFYAMIVFITSESQDCEALFNMTVIDDIDTNIWADKKPTNNAKWIYWKSIADEVITNRPDVITKRPLMTYDQAFRAMTLYLKGKYDDDPLGLFSVVAEEIKDYIQNKNPGLTQKDATWDYWLRCCEESLQCELHYD